MAFPLIASAVVGGGTFLINLNAAYENKEISRQEYEQSLKALEAFERQMRQLRPDETWENIEPKLLEEMAKYSPEIAGFVQENAPELISEPQSQTEKRVQREALQKYAAMAETGRDVISEAQREQALYEADAAAKERQRRLTEGMRQRGMLGTGAELAARLGAEQAAAATSRQEALQGVQQAEMRRRQALSQAATLAGQMRGENLQVESANVNTMNSFNQRLANAKNLYNQYAANTRNEAQAINQQREIQRQQTNLNLQNQYALMNRQQQLAATERAREFDANLATTLYKGRQGIESGRFDADRKFNADMATSLTSGMGAAIGTYTGLEGLEIAKANAGMKAAAEGLTSQSITPSASRQPMGLGVDYSNLTSSEPQESLFIPANIEDIEVNREMSFTPNGSGGSSILALPDRNTSNKYNLGMNSRTRNVFDLREEIDPNNFMIQNPYSKKRY